MKDIAAKRAREQYVVEEMVRLYCKHNHNQELRTHDGMCEECYELAEYAKMRSEKCPFMETKTFCNNCKVHCYKPEMRAKIKTVMRYSGPRMIFVHPVLAIWHVVCSVREKRKMKND